MLRIFYLEKEKRGRKLYFMFLFLQVDFFETFWDSGEARVGEIGARGWKAWMTQQERGGWIQPPAGEMLLFTYNSVNWDMRFTETR